MEAGRPKLLERDRALHALAQAWEAARDGAGRVALVGGEAGIGKTSLVAQFAQSPGVRAEVAWGRCDSLLTPRVLGPAYDIAAQRGGKVLELMESGASRATVFAAFLDSLRRDPCVLVFEDLHWADEATLDLVKYLGRRVADTRALLVLTYRDDEVGPKHPLRLVIGELPAAVRVALAPLSREAVAELAASQGDAARLHAITGGNPFYVTEVLAAEGRDIPASVRDAVLARAARLTPAAREVAELVAIEPGGMEPALVGACRPGSERWLEECESRGILRAHDGVLRFRHELARLAIAEAMGSQRKAALHREVMQMLRRREGAPSLARLAHHAEGAGEPEAVLDYASAAGRRAAKLGAHREAADNFARALRHARSLDAPARATLLEEYARECQIASRFEAAIGAREQAAAAWRSLGESGREAVALAMLSVNLVSAGRDLEAERAIRAALALLPSIPAGVEHARVHRFHAYLCMLERDVRDAIASGEHALELARQAGDDESVVHCHNTIGAAWLVDDDDRGIPALEKSLALARAGGFDTHVSNAFGNLGSACGEVQRFREARGYLEQGIEFCAQHDLDNGRLYQTSWLALALLHLGHWADAAAAARAVLDNGQSNTISRIMATLCLGRLRARRGDPGAWAALDEALAMAEGTQTLQRLAPVRAARAESAWLEGEAGAAAREAAAAYDLALRKAHAWFIGELAYWQWKGGRISEAPPNAAAPFALQVAGRWREAAGLWKERGCPYEEARALAEGDVEAQLEALAMFEALGARPAAARLRQSLRGAGVRRIPRGARPSTRVNPHGLTPREVEILACLAENLTNAEIASRLHISAKTVDHHVGAVLAKLGASSRRAAGRMAGELGLATKIG